VQTTGRLCHKDFAGWGGQAKKARETRAPIAILEQQFDFGIYIRPELCLSGQRRLYKSRNETSEPLVKGIFKSKGSVCSVPILSFPRNEAVDVLLEANAQIHPWRTR
jgi:hypothetical protein